MPTREPSLAVVTGAGRMAGIGRATSLVLAEQGWRVVVVERTAHTGFFNEDEISAGWRGAASVVEEIRAKGGTAWNRECDVSDAGQIDDLASFVSASGQLGLLVNNAGTPGEASAYRIHETPDEVWSRTLDVNITSIYRMARAFVPVFVDSAATDRSIVNISSTAGVRVMPYFGAYPASKAAVDAMTKQLAIELGGLGIRVNAVSPGSTSTDMMAGTFSRTSDRMTVPAETVRGHAVKRIPLRRMANAPEQAAVIAFLASPSASYVTGQIVQVDGGLTVA